MKRGALPGWMLLALVSVQAGADERDLSAAIAALDAPRWSDREEAVATLATDGRWRTADLERIYRDDADHWSAESQMRLIQAIKLRFLSEPRAAVGITADLSYDPASPLRIADLESDSPAIGLLRPGDEIAAVEEVTLPPGRLGWQMFSQEIISRDPGEYVKLLRVRSGVTRSVEVKLGAHPDGPLPVRRSIVERDYWSKRLERLDPHISSVRLRARLEDQAAVDRSGHPHVIEGGRSDLDTHAAVDALLSDDPPLGRPDDSEQWRSRVIVQWREGRTVTGELIIVGPGDRRVVHEIPGGWTADRLDQWVRQRLATTVREGE